MLEGYKQMEDSSVPSCPELLLLTEAISNQKISGYHNNVDEIAQELGVSRVTAYRILEKAMDKFRIRIQEVCPELNVI